MHQDIVEASLHLHRVGASRQSVPQRPSFSVACARVAERSRARATSSQFGVRTATLGLPSSETGYSM